MTKKSKRSPKNSLHKWFIIIAIFWLIIILGFIGMKEFTLMTGKEVLLKTVPVDPRDIFRGDYVILKYDITTIDLNDIAYDYPDFQTRDTIYLTLSKERKYGIPVSVSHKEPTNNSFFIKGIVKKVNKKTLTVEYGLESYFVPEGIGRDLERARKGALEVKVVIDGYGNAIIKELFLEGRSVEF